MMKQCKDLLHNILQTKFNVFSKVERALRSIFNIYFIHIQLLDINQNGIMTIGIKIPHLLSHFNNLKKNILQQMQDNCCNIKDIIFIYHNKKKCINFEKIKEKKIKTPINNITDTKKNEIHNIIVNTCPKKEYHELLYNLYLKAVHK